MLPTVTPVSIKEHGLCRIATDAPLDKMECDSIRGYIFGHMVERATPGMIMFFSDLYADAQWIGENVVVEDGTSFLWGHTSCHTDCGPDGDVAFWTRVMTFDDHVYRITLRDKGNQHHHHWVAVFEKLKGPAES